MLQRTRKAVARALASQVGHQAACLVNQYLAGGDVPIMAGIVGVEVNVRLSACYLRKLDACRVCFDDARDAAP